MRGFFDDVRLMAGLLGLLWLVLLIDLAVFHGRLIVFGIVPRKPHGLIGIPLAPLLHAGPSHLAANSGPFFVLGLMVLRHGRRAFWAASLVIVLLGGFATWCIGPAHTVHVGASALIFGWFGFVVVAAWRAPRLSSVAVASLAILWYGLGVVLGLSPLQYGVSWQGHLTGLFAGALAASGLPLSRRSGNAPSMRVVRRRR